MSTINVKSVSLGILIILIGIGVYYICTNGTGEENKSSTNYDNPPSIKKDSSPSPKKNYLTADAKFDKMVDDLVKEQSEIEERDLLKALIYCSKAVKCLNSDLLKKIYIFDSPNSEPRKINDDEMDKFFISNKSYKENLANPNPELAKICLHNESRYIIIMLRNIFKRVPLSKSTSKPYITVGHNKQVIDEMKESINEAFPKDVIDNMFKKEFKYAFDDSVYNPLEIYFYETLSNSLWKDRN